MPHIFISYRRKDSKWATRVLWEALQEEYGQDFVFMDVESIPLGVSFPQELAQELAKADIYLIVIGPTWTDRERGGQKRLDNADDYVRREVEYALASNRIVIPILIEDTQMPADEELPDSLKSLNKYNALQLSHARMVGDIDKLIGQIGQGNNQQQNDSLAQQTTHGNESAIINTGGDVNITYGSTNGENESEVTKKNTTAWIGFAGAIVAAIIAGLFLYFSGNSANQVNVTGDGNTTTVGDGNQINN